MLKTMFECVKGKTHRDHNGDNTVENTIDFCWIAIFEANITNADDFVQIIFNSFGRFLHGYFSTQFLKVLSQFLGLRY